MLNWFRKLFESTPREPRFVEVGKADILIKLNDGRTGKHTVYGEYLGKHPLSDHDWVIGVHYRVEQWMMYNTKRGTVYMDDDVFIPVCRVKEYQVIYDKYQVEAKE